MILQTFAWWLASSALGVAALPLSYRLFHRLHDRGYGVARALGLLAGGYLLWLGASLRVVTNNLGGAMLALVVLAVLGAVVGRGRWRELAGFLRERRRTVLTMELLFAAAFALWAFVRANNPEITATEKPMELAFLNAVLRSPSFPPHDPWLSGYAISYYHFGYILHGFMARLTLTEAGVAFNLGNALWFALTAVGCHAVVYNLLGASAGRARPTAALLGPLFVLIAGNLAGLLEVAHARHLFWRTDAAGLPVSRVWAWLGLTDLALPPALPPAWMPGRFWMWWQASRVVIDVDLTGVPAGAGPIDELPYFSFLLADNHPHVLALPFVLLAISLALQLYLGGPRPSLRRPAGVWAPLGRWGAPLAGALALGTLAFSTLRALAGGEALPGSLSAALPGALLAGAGALGLAVLLCAVRGVWPSALAPLELGIAAWVFGGLAFLNTWDWPIYLSLLLAGLAWQGRHAGAAREQVARLVVTAGALLAAGVLFYLPWYPSFTSQAGGVLPNLAFPTRVSHFAIMFGTLLAPLAVWLIAGARRGWRPLDGRALLAIGLGLPAGLLALSWLMALVGSLVRPDAVAPGLEGIGALDLRQALLGILLRRLTTSWTALALGGLLGLAALLLWRRAAARREAEEDPAAGFMLLLIGLGGLLVLGPEFMYLKDLFGVRMNTVFKFYFAAWILWGLAAATVSARWSPAAWPRGAALRALALIVLPLAPLFIGMAVGPEHVTAQSLAAGGLPGLSPWLYGALLLAAAAGLYALALRRPQPWSGGAALRALALTPLAAGLVYTFTATWSKTDGFAPPAGRTLDGTAHLQRVSPDDHAAIAWMRENIQDGVLAEAVGGSYTGFARVSAHTGLPTVLGWPWHEVQWRGDARLLGSREDDIRRLYETREWAEAQAILDLYGVEFVYVGPLERATYRPVSESKFQTHMDTIYENAGVAIYARRSVRGTP